MIHLSPIEGLILLALFGATMVLLVWRKTQVEHSLAGFLVANREVSAFRGALSIAVSWVWAPAIFVCSLQAYQNGLPGIFWFTAPNILCFFLFAPFALKLRRAIPDGYTFPEFIAHRYPGEKRVHLAFLAVFLGYQLGAIAINALAGGALIHGLSGLDIRVAIVSISVISLSYSLMGGMRASVFTDVIQMTMLLGIGFVLVPLCIWKAGGVGVLLEGMGGVEGDCHSILNPWLAFSLGIPMTLSLIAGPFGDQMFYQRSLSIRESSVVKALLLGGLIFAVVPITLSLLGFVGAGLVRTAAISVSDPQLIGPIVVANLLPTPALYAFCLLAFAGLCSTMDSSFCAISSLGSIDVYRRYLNPNASSLSSSQMLSPIDVRPSSAGNRNCSTSTEVALGVFVLRGSRLRWNVSKHLCALLEEASGGWSFLGSCRISAGRRATFCLCQSK